MKSGRPGPRRNPVRRGSGKPRGSRRESVAAPYLTVTDSSRENIPPVPPVAQISRRAEGRWLWIGLIVVAAIFMVGFSAFVIGLLGTIDKQNRELVTAQGFGLEQRLRVDSLERESGRREEMIRILSAYAVRLLRLRAPGAGNGAYGTLCWDPDRGAGVLQVTGLPSAPEGNEYRIWLAVGGRLSNAGILDVTESRPALLVVEHPALSSAGFQAVTVTLEPKGEGRGPAGSPLLVGASRPATE